MMQSGQQEYARRTAKIEVQRRKKNRNAVYTVNQDGILVKQSVRRRISFPFRGLLLTVCLFMVFKISVLSLLGDAEYNERAEALTNDSAVGRAGAWIMAADPVTQWSATQIRALLP